VRQVLTLDDGSEWIVDVADSLSTLAAEQASLGRSILVSFALVGALGVAGALLLTTAILQPLGRLRHDLGRRSQSGAELSPDDYPEEVAPLVAEINDLLSRNQSVVERARRQSSDLAHALKTPSAALRNELEHLAATGQDAASALDALARIDAQIGRSLARFRAESSRGTVRLSANVADARDRIVRLFRTMSVAQHLTFDIVPSPALFAAADQQDLEEIFGNLIENAAKWALGTIRISFVLDGNMLRISVEDDGPGIPEAERASVIGPGFRLDTAKPGTGLGLAIISDLVHAYRGEFVLDHADQLGGLRATVTLPRTDAAPVKKPATTGTSSPPAAHTEVG
jgi:signal transduction histidine kinase